MLTFMKNGCWMPKKCVCKKKKKKNLILDSCDHSDVGRAAWSFKASSRQTAE